MSDISRDTRRDVKRLALEAVERGDAVGWFERLYAAAGYREDRIPWSDRMPNPNLVAFRDRHGLPAEGRTAVVVGCGLGDDAVYLADLGFVVTAFDVSPTAVEWCRRRFPEAAVEWVTADLFALPASLVGRFEVVLEAYTVQALPLSRREAALRAVATLVAPDGSLLLFAMGRADGVALALADGPPWPLSVAELGVLEQAGLQAAVFEDRPDAVEPEIRRFSAEYRRTAV
jgi:SAM-dependent methyltransferase